MRRAQGYATIVDPDRPMVERDTFTCAHCNSIVTVEPMADPSTFGGFCCQCHKHICGSCADNGHCTPFEKKLEEMERRDRFVRAALGL